MSDTAGEHARATFGSNTAAAPCGSNAPDDSAASSKAARTAAVATNKVTYKDCMAGRAPIPQDALGKLLFQILMVGGMVTFMATFNGVRHSGLNFFTTHHWVYPVVACVALLVRTQVANLVVGALVPRLVDNRLQGAPAALATTAINVVVMAPLMTPATTLLLYGTHDFLFHIADTLPYALGLAFVVNHFVVGPVVKMVYNNLLTSTRGARLLVYAERDALPWAYILNS